jgi:hypothetical protein
MAQRPKFDITATSLVPVMGGLGVLEIGQEENLPFLGAYFDQDEEYSGLYVILSQEGVTYYEITLEQLESLGFTGGFIFLVDGVSHVLRKVQTADGLWMSKYKTELPLEVLSRMVIDSSGDTIVELVDIAIPDDLPEFEAIYAYYDEEIASLISLVYMSSYGIYSRVDAEWEPEDISVPSYQSLATIEISPEKADELIQMFDSRYGNLSLSEIKQFETLEEEGEVEIEQ